MDGFPDREAPSDLAAGLRAFWTKAGAPRRMLLAVSGGADSLALMRLAAPLAADAEISVATVDHGLRPASASEAVLVKSAAAALGLAHQTLVWSGEKPAAGLQAAARAARYRLLIEGAAAIGAEAILTAHTADDQAETFLMRLARGSGPRGLSAMAAQSWIAAGAGEPARLLRPLLDVRRAALRDMLTAANARFVDDPGNDDPKFERVRVRRLIAVAEAAGLLGVPALVLTANEMRAAASKIEAAEAARFAALGGRFTPFGGVRLADDVAEEDSGLLARLIGAVGGADHAPGEAQAAAALQTAGTGRTATLGGAALERRDGELRIYREAAAVFGRAGLPPLGGAPLAAGERRLWDRRFIVENRLGAAAELRAISPQAAGALGLEADAVGAPALFIGGEIAALPGEYEEIRPLAAERFHRRVNRFQ